MRLGGCAAGRQDRQIRHHIAEDDVVHVDDAAVQYTGQAGIGVDAKRGGDGGGAEIGVHQQGPDAGLRSEEHTSELQSLMRISYAVFCLKKKKTKNNMTTQKRTQQKKTLHN